MKLSGNYENDKTQLKQMLSLDKNFDIVLREMVISETRCSFIFIDSFVKDEILEKIMEFLLKEDSKEAMVKKDAAYFDHRFIPYVEVSREKDMDKMVTQVLSGPLVMLIDGFCEAILIDARTYPLRGVEEPQDDRVLRGSRDGFVETLVFNTALIRRRIRDPHLRVEICSVGDVSHSDLVITYMDDKVDQEILAKVKKRIETIHVHAMTMAQESLAEAIVPHKWYDPFPKVKFSERPDVAASNILEGRVVLLLDNSPSCIILPVTFFDFFDEAQDYYSLPIIGTYLKLTRISVFFVTLLLTPLWYLAIEYIEYLPASLRFLEITDPINVPIFLQLIMMEVGIDAIKLASLYTPQSLSSSFSVIGALILGEFAISAGWVNGEVIFYMAFVAMANFTQSSYEIGYAIKYMRILLLILIALFGVWGFGAGIIFLLFVMIRSDGIFKTPYMYPLIPFNAKNFKRIFIREKLHNKK